MAPKTSLVPVAAAAALLCATSALRAQQAPAASTTLPAVTVTGRAPPAASVGGWGDTPLSATPIAASVVDAAQMRDSNVQRIADLARIDASASDAYNAEGYWDSLTVRGFVIDNRFNYRRDGLPINAETSIPLDNKERLELLKGLSGLQAGTSAPGGLVNLVVKRPTNTDLRSVQLGWQESGSWLAAADLSQRFGPRREAALRLNAAYENLDPVVHDAQGYRRLLALAGEWRVSPGTLLEAEFETSHRSQPSVPGFSMLGDRVPAASSIDPRINLNNQPWTLPVVLDGDTASLRITQRLNDDWSVVAQMATQHLHSDDRTAFPYGAYAADYTCNPCDRFASDGTFSYWEFVSDNERRRTDVFDVAANGRFRLGNVDHALTAGIQRAQFDARFGQQLFDLAGTGTIDGKTVVPRSPGFLDENTNRDETSTEAYLRDAVSLSASTRLWLGLRHTRLERQSVRTDGSAPTDYAQSFVTPWLALSHDLGQRTMAYASWGRGVESDVVPNRARYTNAGQALPAAKSRQTEVGIKRDGEPFAWSLTAFEIVRPVFADIGTDCFADTPGNTCTRQEDGTQRHRGVEASAAVRAGGWTLQGGALWLRATREGSADATLNGLRPVNVPQRTLKLLASYDVPALPGLAVQGAVVHESDRVVLPDNSARIPSYTRTDAAARYTQRVGGTTLTWRIGVDNVFDERAWKESPYQFGHVYLFPLAPRTWRASLQADF